LHLGETTVKRLNVHAALVGRNASRVADEILTAYLARHGRGRELFPADDQPRDPGGDVDDDRPGQGTGISLAGEDEAA
jgi:hypothetical protein